MNEVTPYNTAITTRTALGMSNLTLFASLFGLAPLSALEAA